MEIVAESVDIVGVPDGTPYVHHDKEILCRLSSMFSALAGCECTQKALQQHEQNGTFKTHTVLKFHFDIPHTWGKSRQQIATQIT